MNGNKDDKCNRRVVEEDDKIVLQILSIANGGASEHEIKSQITSLAMADDNKLLNEYVEHLMKSHLIGYDHRTPHVYRTTNKGLRFLESHKRTEK
jgi:predicted transcriptional regulator